MLRVCKNFEVWVFLFHSAAGVVFHMCHAEQLHVACNYDACGKMESYTVELGYTGVPISP